MSVQKQALDRDGFPIWDVFVDNRWCGTYSGESLQAVRSLVSQAGHPDRAVLIPAYDGFDLYDTYKLITGR